jgi:hypothetical protein
MTRDGYAACAPARRIAKPVAASVADNTLRRDNGVMSVLLLDKPISFSQQNTGPAHDSID